jgi:glycosyltransferase involved in cell wall biosynthesis
LVYVANIGDHKNHRLLLEALPLLLRRFPELQLMLTLEPPSPAPRGGAYERDLHRRASALGVQAHLCWLGHLSSDEVYWALQQSELSVFPSLTESFGLPLVESMVAACPIAAADRPYAHEVCGEAACYFDPENATSAFTSINEVLQDRLLRDRLVRQGAARSQQFSYRGIVEQVAETLEAAAEPVRAAPISPRGLPVMQKALFLYGNQPEALPVSMMLYLRRLGTYQVDLIYWERIGSRISVPLTARLSEVQRYPVRWPVGRSFISKLWHRIVLLLLFVKQIRALRPDIIHAWNFDMLLAARLAVATLPQSKLVFTLQDTTQWMLSRSLRSLQRWVYRKVDILFVTSEGFDTELLRRFRLIPEHTRVHFVANAPPAQFFAKFEPRKAQGDLTVGYIGFLRGRQGITTLVKAAELARQEGSPVSLLFAGTGVDQELVDAFAKKDKHIKVAGPYRYEEHILDLYRQVDVLYAVYDSSYDKKIHLAYRLCEAINCRLPIIVAKGTHMAEVTERLGVGVSVEAGDVAGLATALKNLHANESLRSRIARNCQAHRHEFVFEFYEDRILQAYKELRSHPVCKQNARARKHLIADKIPL